MRIKFIHLVTQASVCYLFMTTNNAWHEYVCLIDTIYQEYTSPGIKKRLLTAFKIYHSKLYIVPKGFRIIQRLSKLSENHFQYSVNFNIVRAVRKLVQVVYILKIVRKYHIRKQKWEVVE